MNETISLDCKFWNVLQVSQPTEPIIINVSIVPARVVIKKDTTIRIPSPLPKSETIVVDEKHLMDYYGFTNYIKEKANGLN